MARDRGVARAIARIGLGGSVGLAAGCGDTLAVAVELARQGRRPTLMRVDGPVPLDPLRGRLIAPALEEYAANRAAFDRNRGRRLPFPVLHPLGDRLAFGASPDDTPGSPDVGLAGFHHSDFAAADLRRAADWALVVAASAWNARVLRDRGLANVVACPPGIDPAVFHPAPRAGLLPGRFAVFCGGAPGHRGGADIAVAAFRAFRQRHPEALLLCGWTAAAGDAADLRRLAASPHVDGAPDVVDGVVQLLPWLARNGIAADAAVEAGAPGGAALAGVLRECDLALFPARGAGAPDHAALAALACGVPTAVAGNTGYLDLVGDHAYVLKRQADVAALTGDAGMADWGEGDVEELLAVMERAFARRAEAAEKGRAAARFMEGRTWARHVERLLAAVDRAAAGAPVPPPAVKEDYGWGLALHRAGRLAAAERIYDDVLARAPDDLNARGDRGNARRERGDDAGAEADFRAILARRPGHPRALNSLGNLLRRTGRLEEAADCLRQALAGGDTPALRWDYAYVLLLLGRYGEAWPHFDHRHAHLRLRTPEPSKPRWDGATVTGTLLVLDEQGLGDTLQFLRFLPRIPVGPGGRVIFAGKPAVLPAVRRFMPADDVLPWDGRLPRSQAWVPLMSLPARLGVMRPADVPPPGPDNLAEAERVARWRPRVRGDDDRPVVGLCWRGNPEHGNDAARSPGLAPLRPILDVAGLRFVALQVGPGRDEIAGLGLSGRLDDVGGAIEAAGSSVLDTLAALRSCDFVIAPDTAVLHMAGLAGRPGLALLSTPTDWRWIAGRDDTPWYPLLRLIRQRMPGDWPGAVAEAVAALSAWRQAAAI
ncbi:MAG: tetratricopeptide repeat protein [Rhodospirillaceae bacterium]